MRVHDGIWRKKNSPAAFGKTGEYVFGLAGLPGAWVASKFVPQRFETFSKGSFFGFLSGKSFHCLG